MKYCPFCGSPAAAWPEHASDYVRGYPLCEYHMGKAISMAEILFYDDAIVESENMRVRVTEEVTQATTKILEKWASKIDPQYDPEEDSLERVSPVLRDISIAMDWAWPNRADYGEPIKRVIEDSEVDRWFSVRIKDLSNRGNRRYRCTSEKPGKPDGRCVNYANREGGKCESCEKKGTMVSDALRDKSKIDRIMRIIRDDQPQNHQSNPASRQG